MMPDLVRDHVRLREISGRTQASLQIAIKCEVNVYLLIARTVKWAGRAPGRPAGRRHLIGEKNQSGNAVFSPRLPEDSRPDIFGVSENHRDKMLEFVVRGACRTRGASADSGRRLLARLIEYRSGIDL